MATGSSGDYLNLTDAELLAQCRVERFRASGPGGQHRNKTDSGVRLRHEPTGTISQATERRSQHENRSVALARLRMMIALGTRRGIELEGYTAPVEVQRILPGAGGQRLRGGHPEFWRGVQGVLDVFVACGCSISETAAHLGISTGQLSRLLVSEPEVLRAVNRLREERGMGAVRA